MAFGLQPYSCGRGDSSSLYCTVDGKTGCCYDADGKSVLQTAFQAPSTAAVEQVDT
jgi:hypothetical protein